MIKKLLKYFQVSCVNSHVPKMELLSGSEALEHFAGLWGDYKADTMMMLAVIEYEYISSNNFSDKEIAAVKTALGSVGLFMRDCKDEYQDFLRKQQKNIEK